MFPLGPVNTGPLFPFSVAAMKQYQIYLFTKPECPPCIRLKSWLETLPNDYTQEVKMVERSSNPFLFEQFDVTLHPTMVVSHVDLKCELSDGDEFCSQSESIVEKVEGANNIIETLDATISAYTYADHE